MRLREQDAPGRAAQSMADAPVPEGRLRILQVILSRGFAGSERAAAEACNALAQRHDVALVIRSDHRGRGDASVRDALDAGVEEFEIPAWWNTRRRLEEIIRSRRLESTHAPPPRHAVRRTTQARSGARVHRAPLDQWPPLPAHRRDVLHLGVAVGHGARQFPRQGVPVAELARAASSARRRTRARVAG